MHVLASINIWMNPNLFQVGGLVLSWHGLLTFVAVATAVYLVARWGTKEGLNTDAIYSVSVWAIIGGIVGARVLHVIDFWADVYRHDPLQVFYLWNGGIALYGAISGGFAGGSLYIIVRNSRWFLALWGKFFRFAGEATTAPLPSIGRLADIAAPALLIAMAIGRIGDVINGEHWAKATDLPWGVIYTHPLSLGGGRPASHPAVAYELLFDLVLLAILWPLRNRLRPPGMLFVLYGALYSVGRFFLSFLRDEFNEYFLGLNEAQIVSLVVMVATIPLLVYKAQFVRAAPPRAASRRQPGRRRAR
jgi:phosphatidylglycerol:prolipoprotein diacylglycerol transferase